MPCAQPLMNSKMNIMVTLDVAQGAKPKMNITPADTRRPNGRKKRGLERSDTRPMRNFDRP
ncbi:hypothetical protein D9M71_669460 [compost metagenome]